jgi:hypothetical protein
MNSIKILAIEWDRAFVAMLKEEEYSIRQVERLLNETYRLCTEYCTSDTVPKEMCMVFSNIQWFMNTAADIYKIDNLTTSSDSADVDAIDTILDAIEYGFYTGKYEYTYPQLSVTDNKQRTHVYDLNKSFLEDFIDALR